MMRRNNKSTYIRTAFFGNESFSMNCKYPKLGLWF